jgi:hypothetical protein
MGNGSHPSDRKLNASDLQAKADRTGQGKRIARKAQSEADQLDMKKH